MDLCESKWVSINMLWCNSEPVILELPRPDSISDFGGFLIRDAMSDRQGKHR